MAREERRHRIINNAHTSCGFCRADRAHLGVLRKVYAHIRALRVAHRDLRRGLYYRRNILIVLFKKVVEFHRFVCSSGPRISRSFWTPRWMRTETTFSESPVIRAISFGGRS